MRFIIQTKKNIWEIGERGIQRLNCNKDMDFLLACFIKYKTDMEKDHYNFLCSKYREYLDGEVQRGYESALRNSQNFWNNKYEGKVVESSGWGEKYSPDSEDSKNG